MNEEKKLVPLDDMINMIQCCYFVGNCKACPFYKKPKFGVIGRCPGQKKVGEALLDWFITIDQTDLFEQAELFRSINEG